MGPSVNTDFTAGASGDWNVAAGSISYGSNGAGFTVAKRGDAPTIETKDYFFFGTAEVTLQAAPGTGIVSSIVLESDDLDEVDWVCFFFSLAKKWTDVNTSCSTGSPRR